jgi:hypothetical protein
LKGNTTWATRTVVLGWVLDTTAKTIQLLAHCVERLHTILASIPPDQWRTSTKKWQQVIRELRSMALAIPGAHGLFCSLQEALRHKVNDGTRARFGRHVHAFLQDFRWLADELVSRPTSMLKVVPSSNPGTIGACDASHMGMGGVLFIPQLDGAIKPYLWRSPFPSKVTRQLVSTVNPGGGINNSDLELAGSVVQHDLLCQLANVEDITVHTCYENTATVCWQRKGSATTVGPVAYLLRLQSLHQRHYRYAPLHGYIPGVVSLMIDVTTRSW